MKTWRSCPEIPHDLRCLLVLLISISLAGTKDEGEKNIEIWGLKTFINARRHPGMPFPLVCLLGLACGYLYSVSRPLVPAIILHALYNFGIFPLWKPA